MSTMILDIQAFVAAVGAVALILRWSATDAAMLARHGHRLAVIKPNPTNYQAPKSTMGFTRRLTEGSS
jgi:hypothetical protein